MRPHPFIQSQKLTEFANDQGMKGQVLIIDHNYYLTNGAGNKRRIGFTLEQAQSFLVRKAARMRIHTLEVEPGKPLDPDQSYLIGTSEPGKPKPDQPVSFIPDGQLTLI